MSIPNTPPKSGGYIPRDRNWQPDALTPPYKTSIKRSPQSALLSFPSTLSEETSPVFGHHMLGDLDNDLIHNYAQAGESAIGPRIIVHGRVLDETGRGVPGALLEFWQANAGGRYRHKKESYLAPLDPNFGGCGRTITGEDGSYEFRTIQPGPSIFGHGFAQRLITQMYFEGDPHIKLCPIVGILKTQAAIDALTAPLDMNRTVPMDSRAFKFDIVLRGQRQTYFENRKEGL